MTTKAKLLIDNGGRIECEEHAPYRGSDTFFMGQWRPITVAERTAFHAEIGSPARCETCDAIDRNAKTVTT